MYHRAPLSKTLKKCFRVFSATVESGAEKMCLNEDDIPLYREG